MVTGELWLYSNHFKELGFAYHTEEGVLGQVAGAIYVSSTASTGPHSAPTEQDYQDFEFSLRKKWLADYGMGCWLIIYTFGVRPDFLRLTEIIQSLNNEYGTKFAEVWFSKPYGIDDLDDVRNLYRQRV